MPPEYRQEPWSQSVKGKTYMSKGYPFKDASHGGNPLNTTMKLSATNFEGLKTGQCEKDGGGRNWMFAGYYNPMNLLQCTKEAEERRRLEEQKKVDEQKQLEERKEREEQRRQAASASAEEHKKLEMQAPTSPLTRALRRLMPDTDTYIAHIATIGAFAQ